MGNARVSWLGQPQCLSARNYAMGHIRLMLVPMVVPTIIIAKVIIFFVLGKSVWESLIP